MCMWCVSVCGVGVGVWRVACAEADVCFGDECVHVTGALSHVFVSRGN